MEGAHPDRPGLRCSQKQLTQTAAKKACGKLTENKAPSQEALGGDFGARAEKILQVGENWGCRSLPM